MTAKIGAEGLINSRPLTYQSTDPTDDVPLTPNHFLHRQIGVSLHQPQWITHSSIYKRDGARFKIVHHFWCRWLQEWLSSISEWTKRHLERRDLQVGEVVLVVSPDTAQGIWPLRRVVEVYPGVDRRVRVAKLQVCKGTLVRPVVKLCPLECNS